MKKSVCLISGVLLMMGCTSITPITPGPGTKDSWQGGDVNNPQKDVVDKDSGNKEVSDIPAKGEDVQVPGEDIQSQGEDVQARDAVLICTTDEDCKEIDMATGPCQKLACQEGKCVSVALAKGTTCTPAIPDGLDADCVGGTCDENGKCLIQIKVGTACDDGNLCTDNDVCTGGKCRGTAKACPDDGNACTTEECVPATGDCKTTRLGKETPCDDDNSCTKGDYCDEGACVSGKNTCTCTTDDDCKAYADSNLCNGVLKCVGNDSGSKVCLPTSVVTCDVSEDDQCHQTKCIPETGKCLSTVLAGQACDDGNKCTYNDKCLSNGRCKGNAIQCHDTGKPCTEAVCDSATGKCKTEDLPDKTLCSLDDKCIINTQCQSGECKGIKDACDDHNECTTDSCDSGKGCIHKADSVAACDDKNTCTKGTTCQADGTCGGGKSICECSTDADCHDTVLCDGKMKCRTQKDGTKKCVNDLSAAVACDTSQDDVCNQTKCVPNTGCRQTILTGPCDDKDVCTKDTTCNANGTCGGGSSVPGCCHADADCDDGNPCTADACTTATGKCTHNSRQKNFDTCGSSKVCWNGNCLTHNLAGIKPPFSFGQTSNFLFNSIGVYGNRRFATAVQRDEDVKCSFVGAYLYCSSLGTWTDQGWVYEIKGIKASMINKSALPGQTGKMDKPTDGKYPFPSSPAIIPPIADIAYNMAVGWKGAAGLLRSQHK